MAKKGRFAMALITLKEYSARIGKERSVFPYGKIFWSAGKRKTQVSACYVGFDKLFFAGACTVVFFIFSVSDLKLT